MTNKEIYNNLEVSNTEMIKVWQILKFRSFSAVANREKIVLSGGKYKGKQFPSGGNLELSIGS